jgi:hypothetical protein
MRCFNPKNFLSHSLRDIRLHARTIDIAFASHKESSDAMSFYIRSLGSYIVGRVSDSVTRHAERGVAATSGYAIANPTYRN